MKILFDQGTPVPRRRHLTGHIVDTALPDHPLHPTGRQLATGHRGEV
jgi:hypothetical protein